MIPILTNIFQLGWNHQLENIIVKLDHLKCCPDLWYFLSLSFYGLNCNQLAAARPLQVGQTKTEPLVPQERRFFVETFGWSMIWKHDHFFWGGRGERSLNFPHNFWTFCCLQGHVFFFPRRVKLRIKTFRVVGSWLVEEISLGNRGDWDGSWILNYQALFHGIPACCGNGGRNMSP